ncbi:MAG: hypothetical protein WEB52_05600 [Dehalococcoidia bacterium]
MDAASTWLANMASRWLATVGMLIAGPAFLLNFIAHDGIMPGPDEVDRTDGAFSLMFMAGVALIVAALIITRPSPVGRKGRWLLYAVAAMVVLGAVWSAFIIADPNNRESSNPLIIVGDASWPLHQALMLVVGIVALRARRWPAPARFALFGPALGVVLVVVSAALNTDIVAATAIGAGWVIAGFGVLAATASHDAAGESRDAAVRAVAAS